jgi:hypothetical protein
MRVQAWTDESQVAELRRSIDAMAAERPNNLLNWLRSAVDGSQSWLLVAVSVAFMYISWSALTLVQASASDFIHVGRSFVERSTASPLISTYSNSHHYDGDIGYDGQFMYFIALDPVGARSYLDYPAYRYTRILYPLLAGAVGLHSPDLVADALIAINLVMIALGIAVLGAWLRKRGVSPWAAAVYGFYPGVFIALQRDTSEIMASSLVIVAIYVYDYAPRWRIILSAALFALASLTRETTAVFAGIWALGVLLSGEGPPLTKLATNWRLFLVFIGIAFGPLMAWKVFLLVWLGSLGLEGILSPVPFGGIHYLLRHGAVMEQLRTVLVPGFLCLGAGAIAIVAGIRTKQVWALFANSLLYTAFLGPVSFEDLSSSARVTIPIALTAVLALPDFVRQTRAWFWASAALWLAPMIFWLLLPVEGGIQHLIVQNR